MKIVVAVDGSAFTRKAIDSFIEADDGLASALDDIDDRLDDELPIREAAEVARGGEAAEQHWRRLQVDGAHIGSSDG